MLSDEHKSLELLSSDRCVPEHDDPDDDTPAPDSDISDDDDDTTTTEIVGEGVGAKLVVRRK